MSAKYQSLNQDRSLYPSSIFRIHYNQNPKKIEWLDRLAVQPRKTQTVQA